MSEIRLQCPGCGTEYHLPEGSIPRDGRRVECTSCDHVWLAFEENGDSPRDVYYDARAADEETEANVSGIIRHDLPKSGDQAKDMADDAPLPASRRIPESVLSILREEVEFERRARRSEITESSSQDSDEDLSEQLWPATTITDDVPPVETRTVLLPHSRDKTAEDKPASVVESGVEKQQRTTDSASPAIKDSVNSPEASPSREHPRKGAYVMGFGTALAAAAAAVGLYIIAPTFSADDRFGPEITEYREIVDAGRDWLAQQTNRLVSRE